MNYRFLTPALIELREAAEYYEAQVAGLGADFIFETEFAIDRILQFPNAWGRISEGYRHCNLRRFPFTIIYSTDDMTRILLVSVFHQSRKPLTWRRNL